MIRCGIDEAGYGPRLGPLVVGASFIRGGWPTSPCPVRVADSKKVYSPAKGLAELERTALSFAAQRRASGALSYRKLRESLAGCVPELPWYGDFSLPCAVDEISVAPVRKFLGGRSFGMIARVVEPVEINRVSNKADLLFRTVAGAIREILDRHPKEDAGFAIGKQGGRRFYAPLILESFGVLPAIEREEPGRSTYRFPERRREVVLDFLEDGEDRDFGIALSSILAKYLREGAMRLFNEYWQGRVKGLRPTAGYGTDGARFYREIESRLETAEVLPEHVFRTR